MHAELALIAATLARLDELPPAGAEAEAASKEEGR